MPFWLKTMRILTFSLCLKDRNHLFRKSELSPPARNAPLDFYIRENKIIQATVFWGLLSAYLAPQLIQLQSAIEILPFSVSNMTKIGKRDSDRFLVSWKIGKRDSDRFLVSWLALPLPYRQKNLSPHLSRYVAPPQIKAEYPNSCRKVKHWS
jgi:hypothetical protein